MLSVFLNLIVLGNAFFWFSYFIYYVQKMICLDINLLIAIVRHTHFRMGGPTCERRSSIISCNKPIVDKHSVQNTASPIVARNLLPNALTLWRQMMRASTRVGDKPMPLYGWHCEVKMRHRPNRHSVDNKSRAIVQVHLNKSSGTACYRNVEPNQVVVAVQHCRRNKRQTERHKIPKEEQDRT